MSSSDVYVFTLKRKLLTTCFKDWIEPPKFWGKPRWQPAGQSRVSIKAIGVMEQMEIKHITALEDDDVIVKLECILITEEKKPSIFVSYGISNQNTAAVCIENTEPILTHESHADAPSQRMLISSAIAHCLSTTLQQYFIEDTGRLSFTHIASVLSIPEIAVTLTRKREDVFESAAPDQPLANEVRFNITLCVDRRSLHPEPVFNKIDWLTIESASEEVLRKPQNFNESTRLVFGVQ